jgi:hypothetical protein
MNKRLGCKTSDAICRENFRRDLQAKERFIDSFRDTRQRRVRNLLVLIWNNLPDVDPSSKSSPETVKRLEAVNVNVGINDSENANVNA